MHVEMIESFASADATYTAGERYRVSKRDGGMLIDAGLALPTRELPADIATFYRRLEAGAGQRCLFLPMMGEFGHLVMSHIRIVHFHQASEKIVCCRRGEEVLFPSAAGFFYDYADPIADKFRIATMRRCPFDWRGIEQLYPDHLPIKAGDMTPAEELIAIHPERRLPFKPTRRGLTADVVLGVRRRDFCVERNWQHWQELADRIRVAGYTFAVIGAKPTSFDVTGQEAHSGDFDTDAAIELLQSCRLYVGTDSGNSHLAATVGARMLIFRETAGQSRDLTARMEQVNEGRIDVMPPGTWEEPAAVIRWTLEFLRHERCESFWSALGTPVHGRPG